MLCVCIILIMLSFDVIKDDDDRTSRTWSLTDRWLASTREKQFPRLRFDVFIHWLCARYKLFLRLRLRFDLRRLMESHQAGTDTIIQRATELVAGRHYKRPDGTTLLPWARGKPMALDVTVPDTLSPILPIQPPNHVQQPLKQHGTRCTNTPGWSAFTFLPVAIENETAGAWHDKWP